MYWISILRSSPVSIEVFDINSLLAISHYFILSLNSHLHFARIFLFSIIPHHILPLETLTVLHHI